MSEHYKRRIWNKATPIKGFNPYVIRRDSQGRIIRYDHYGNRQSNAGWEYDHIIPRSRGGSDAFSNIQPLHWRNNVRKGSRLY